MRNKKPAKAPRRRMEHGYRGWDGFDGLSRIRLKNRDRKQEEGNRHKALEDKNPAKARRRREEKKELEKAQRKDERKRIYHEDKKSTKKKGNIR